MGEMEERIDFDELEAELQKAIEADVRYWQQNDAKFRAVNQKVASYEEFREMVNAAHLKPVEKKDALILKPRSVWNSNAQSWKEITTKKDEVLAQERKTATSNHKFSREWRLKNDDERFSYLGEIVNRENEDLKRNELGFDLMGDVFRVLFEKSDNNVHDAVIVFRIMKLISKTSRFQLNLHFVNPKEKEYVQSLINQLERTIKENLHEIMNEGIEENAIEQLKLEYQTI